MEMPWPSHRPHSAEDRVIPRQSPYTSNRKSCPELFPAALDKIRKLSAKSSHGKSFGMNLLSNVGFPLRENQLQILKFINENSG